LALLELKNVCKNYLIGGEIVVPALKNATLNIDAGEFVAIMGASGSGKSTLLAILGLLDKADSGEIRLLGREIGRLSDNDYAHLRNKFFGFIFQSFNLLPRLNIVANAQLPLIYSGQTGKEDQARVNELLQKVGLGDRLRHQPNQLSGGQQQRVAVVRALVNQPLVILADEPTGNLDSKSSAEIITLLKDLNAEGKTIIMVTHEPNFAEAATRIIRLKDGEVVEDLKKSAPNPAAAGGAVFSLHNAQSNLLSWRRLKNYIFEALVSLANNKLRSLLSILGVLIGVAAVIAMLAMGSGAQKQVEQNLAALGTNLLSVRGSSPQRGISQGGDSGVRFTLADLEAIKKVEGVERAVPYVNGRAQIVFGGRNWNTQVVGTSPDFQSVRDSVPAQGRFFTEAEIRTKAKVAVLGQQVVDQLFGESNPLGKWVRINRINFLVIGQLPVKGSSGFQNQDDRVIIPVATAMSRLVGTEYVNSFDIKVNSTEQLESVQKEIPPLLIALHRLQPTQVDQIDVRNMADIQKAAGEMASTFALLLGGVAAVSLLVGGIGIMNIMLVMVMERTHEIGLRKALGAENGDILMQFMVEAVLICVLGGAVGSLLGILISWAISTFAGWNVLISLWSIVLAFTFSALTGLVFGLWPAWRAAQLQPIEALRYE